MLENYLSTQENSAETFCNMSSSSATVLAKLGGTLDCLDIYFFIFEFIYLHLEEVNIIYSNIFHRITNLIAVGSRILPKLCGTYDKHQIITWLTANDLTKWRALKNVLGNSFRPQIGLYSGSYSLDLMKLTDRRCLAMLIVRNARNQLTKPDNKFHLSFHGSCFRNEFFKDMEKSETRICPSAFTPIPYKGKIDFDFVDTGASSIWSTVLPDNFLLDVSTWTFLYKISHNVNTSTYIFL